MTADEIAYDELCVGCTDEKRCRDNPVDCCDRYIARVEELEPETDMDAEQEGAGNGKSV